MVRAFDAWSPMLINPAVTAATPAPAATAAPVPSPVRPVLRSLSAPFAMSLSLTMISSSALAITVSVLLPCARTLAAGFALRMLP